jgi:hypothetical protein
VYEKKRVRSEKEEVIDRLFKLFEQKEYWTLNELKDATEQPVVRLSSLALAIANAMRVRLSGSGRERERERVCVCFVTVLVCILLMCGAAISEGDPERTLRLQQARPSQKHIRAQTRVQVRCEASGTPFFFPNSLQIDVLFLCPPPPPLFALRIFALLISLVSRNNRASPQRWNFDMIYVCISTKEQAVPQTMRMLVVILRIHLFPNCKAAEKKV